MSPLELYIFNLLDISVDEIDPPFPVLQPIYKEAAAELKAENPPIYLAMMDADPMDNRNIALRYGAKGFPTVKVFKNNAGLHLILLAWSHS